MKIAIYTLGCKVNQYESQVLAGEFKKLGMEIVPFTTAADAYIINTCSVTAESDRKSRQILNRAISKNPNALICVTGCYSQIQSETIKKIPGVDIVTGTKDRLSLIKLITEHKKSDEQVVNVRDVMKVREFESMSIEDTIERTRISIKIQDGCDNFCSYCIIPYTRGPIVSKPFEEIRSELKSVVERGYKEIVLTGIHISSYGKDMKFKYTLADVLQLCEETEGDFRVRLGSLNLSGFTQEFLSRLPSFKKLCPHFHISLQSGCERTLRNMNRKYTPKEFSEVLKAIRNALPDASVTTDVIVGFPGETEEDFNDSLSFVGAQEFLKVHVFPYSRRPGTVADNMDGQITRAEKSKRAHIMGDAASAVGERFLDAQIGKKVSVLVEECIGENLYRGYTKNYCMTEFSSESDIRGEIVNVEILGRDGEILKGALC